MLGIAGSNYVEKVDWKLRECQLLEGGIYFIK